jgi:hypothetical protein
MSDQYYDQLAVQAISYVRSYELRGEVRTQPSAVPDWARDWINSRYLVRPGSVAYYQLPSIPFELDDRQLRMSRSVLAYPSLAAADVMLTMSAPELPSELYDGDGRLDPTMHPKDIAIGSAGQKVHELWNSVMTEISGVAPGNWPYDPDGLRRTQFGLVCWSSKAPRDAALHRGIVETDKLAFVGRFRMYVVSSDEFDPKRFMGYVILAGLCSRTRMLTEEIRDEVAGLARRSVNNEARPSTLLQEAIDLQEHAIRMRQETSGQTFLGGDTLPLVFEDIRNTVTMGDVERQEFEQSLNGLQMLTEGLLQIYVERAGRRVSIFGLFFGGFSLLFGGVAVVELARAWSEAEWTALTAVTCAWILAGLAAYLLRRRAT